jgi:hypothetical protein
LSSDAHDSPPLLDKEADKSAREFVPPEASGEKEDAENTQLAKEGFDYRLVSYYSAAGPRSKRFEGAIADASDIWTQATDPDADAMFVASLKKNDAERGFGWNGGRTDPPFIWWEQRECYDKNWHPGKDSAMCERHHVKTPSVHLYKLPKLDQGAPAAETEEVHGPLPSVEFRGPRTVKGMLDFLRKETDVDKYMESQQDFIRAMLGSNGPDQNNSADQVAAAASDQQVANAAAAVADKLYRSVNAVELQAAASPLVCLTTALAPTSRRRCSPRRKFPTSNAVASFL